MLIAITITLIAITITFNLIAVLIAITITFTLIAVLVHQIFNEFVRCCFMLPRIS